MNCINVSHCYLPLTLENGLVCWRRKENVRHKKSPVSNAELLTLGMSLSSIKVGVNEEYPNRLYSLFFRFRFEGLVHRLKPAPGILPNQA